MAEAFELYASFKIDTSGYTQELNKIRQEMQQFQQELNSFAVHPTFDAGRFRAELQQAQQQSTQATEEIQRLQQQIQSLQQAADGGGSGDSGGGVLSGFLSQLDVIGDIASGQFIANMAVNGINSIIDGITGSIDESIGLASDLVETQNVVDVTFEDSASTINKWAQEALNAYGITETKAKQYSSTLGAMLKSMGIADDQVLQMSIDMAGLAADMASFYNLDHDTAFEKIRSGISGETEPLKALGINMSVANLNAFALEKGMNKAFDKMSQAEQATLRYQYLLEATKDAQGDFARTGDSFSNEMRKLQTNLDRIKTEFGKGLLGVVTPAISLLNNVLSDKSYQYKDAEKIYTERNQALFDAQATYAESMTIVNAMRNMEDESGEAIKSTDAWRLAIEELINVMPGLAQYVDLTSDAIIGNTESINQYVDAVNGVSQYAAHENAVNDAAALVDADKQELAKLNAYNQYLQSIIDSAESGTIKAERKAALERAYEYFKSTVPNLAFADTWKEFTKSSPGNPSQYTQQQNVQKGLKREYGYYQLTGTAADAWNQLMEAEEAYNNPSAYYIAQQQENQKQIEATTQKLQEDTKAYNDATAAQNDFVESNEKAKKQYDFDKAVEDEKKALEDLKTALKDVETYRADTLKKAQEAYKGVASGMGYMVTHTQEEMKKLLDTDYSKENVLSWYGTNADALHAYNDALQQAEEAGVDVGILSGLTTYSRDNDAYLSRLLNLTPEEIKQLNADYQRARDEENAMAETKTRYTLADDETYQAMLETVQKSLEAFEQKDEIAAYMAENNSAVLAGINDMKQTLVKEIPQINALLKSLGFNNKIETKIHEWTTDFSQNETPYDFLGDISTGKGRAANAPLAVGGHLMEYWAPNPETNPQELADVLAALEAKQKENQKVREGNGFWDKAQEAADKAYENRKQVAENLTFIREMHTTLETMQENYLTALKERKAPNITNNENGVLWVRIENPADVAKAVSGLPPTTIQNNFSVDGKMIATAIAPHVNSAIGGTIRSNLMFKKWGD
jgi:hypothetical protein